ncbi:hypothetical protein [Luteimonas terricola]|uniref:Uncharacterized protein n=1 Tax=Luteimonas terricola TaxID=645597 RepID=A0ABQ2E6Y6_9GAMM|nr:hypothetical protein [Luteimonas terricola]GGJ98213.1 hypothetical protein GCM10011394_03900 [Luteimonas terricola]
MALFPRRAHARIWRRLAFATLLAMLLMCYWMALRALERQAGDGTQPVVRPAPMLDRHTPRVD